MNNGIMRVSLFAYNFIRFNIDFTDMKLFTAIFFFLVYDKPYFISNERQ